MTVFAGLIVIVTAITAAIPKGRARLESSWRALPVVLDRFPPRVVRGVAVLALVGLVVGAIAIAAGLRSSSDNTPQTVYAGPQPPSYAPSFAGQTVSWLGNNFRSSDDGRTWIFQGSDACRAMNVPGNPGTFRLLSPSTAVQFPIDQIPPFTWAATSDEHGRPVQYQLKINDIVAPDARASQGAQPEYSSAPIDTNSFTPPQSYFRQGFSYEWHVEAISLTNTPLVAAGCWQFTVLSSR